jgi:hypothetical protein
MKVWVGTGRSHFLVIITDRMRNGKEVENALLIFRSLFLPTVIESNKKIDHILRNVVYCLIMHVYNELKIQGNRILNPPDNEATRPL